MKVALVAPVEESVPPKKYGGTELVVAHIADGLVERGHDVTLFASGDSTTKATLVPLTPQSIRVLTQGKGQEKLREAWKVVALARLQEALAGNHFDIIHQHMGWRLTPFESRLGAPVVATLHGILSPEYLQFVFGEYAKNKYISITDAQRRGLPSLQYVATVYNGIDIGQFTYVAAPGDYLAFLGRMSPEKGPKEAILTAKELGLPLKMAAKVDAVDRQYFETEIEPLIDGEHIQFVGEVGPEERNLLLGNARALLAPIQWEEPFGLYFVEAMATGTPVLSVGRGSVPEVVAQGVTGLYSLPASGLPGYVDTVRQFLQLSSEQHAAMRTASRKRVESLFTVDHMVEGYLQAYGAVIAGKQ